MVAEQDGSSSSEQEAEEGAVLRLGNTAAKPLTAHRLQEGIINFQRVHAHIDSLIALGAAPWAVNDPLAGCPCCADLPDDGGWPVMQYDDTPG